MELTLPGDRTELFDHVVFACHSDQALALLDDASRTERDILGAIPYQNNEVVLHTEPGEHPPYDAVHHPEYEEEGGRVQYLTYSRRTTGWFGTEFPVIRVTLE